MKYAVRVRLLRQPPDMRLAGVAAMSPALIRVLRDARMKAARHARHGYPVALVLEHVRAARKLNHALLRAKWVHRGH
jgi:hypothetical protein